MRRWLSGDERTLGVFLVGGVLIMAFLRLDYLRTHLGVGPTPQVLLLVATVIAWWSLLPRSFVWLNPADLTWRDFGDIDRVALVARRLTGGWVVRQLVLGYLLALLAALVAAPASWVVASVAVLAGAGLLALGVARRPRTAPAPEAVAALVLAGGAVMARPGPVILSVLAAGLAGAGFALVRPGSPPVADVSRPLAVPLLADVPVWGGALVVAAVVALALFR